MTDFHSTEVLTLVLFIILARKLLFKWNLRLTLCFNMKITHFWHKIFKENSSAHTSKTWQQARKFQDDILSRKFNNKHRVQELESTPYLLMKLKKCPSLAQDECSLWLKFQCFKGNSMHEQEGKMKKKEQG